MSDKRVFCKQIPASEFNNAESKAHTARCVEELVESTAYQSFQRHQDYKELFVLIWVTSSLLVVALFYYHFIVFSNNGEAFFSLSQVEPYAMQAAAAGGAGSSASMPHLALVALLLCLYLLPSVVVKSFVDVFGEASRWESLRVYFFLVALSVLVVSYGGRELHHPPFLTTEPPLPWQELQRMPRREGRALLAAALTRALPPQGYLLAGLVSSLWYQSHWRRMWHVPLPLLTVPLLVGLAGALWWRVATLTLPYFVTDGGAATEVTLVSWRLLHEDVPGALSLWQSIASGVLRALAADLTDLPAALYQLPAATLYAASTAGVLVLFITSLLWPLVAFVVRTFLHLLPTEPAVWGLLLAASVGGAAYLARVEQQAEFTWYKTGLGCLAATLLYNGFRV